MARAIACTRSHALALRAQLAVVDHLVEQRQARLERLLAVLVVEEFRVGQSRPHDPLVALDHGARVIGLDIADDEEFFGQPAVAIEQRKVLLVGLHGQDQALGRHRQEGRVEAAQQHLGSLDQRGHFVEQGIVVDRGQPFLRRSALQLARDFTAPLRKAGPYRALARELLRVVVGVLHDDRVRLGFEAVAARRAPGAQAECVDRYYVGPMQRHQAVRRAYEADAGPAVFELVAHDLGDRQCGQRRIERHLQAGGQRGAAHRGGPEQRLGLAVGLALEPVDDRCIGAQCGELFQQRRCGLSLRIDPNDDWHQLVRHCAVASLGMHRADVRSQPTRRGIGCDDRVLTGQALRLQVRRQQLGERLAECLQRLGRELFGEQLDQQALGGCRHAVARTPSSLAAFFAIAASTSSARALGAIGKPSRARLSR